MEEHPAGERRFRLSLTIADEAEFDGVYASLALVTDPTNPDVPVLMVSAGGVDASGEGAGIVADMLRDAASAISSHLAQGRVSVDTADQSAIAAPVTQIGTLIDPSKPKPKPRPRFNPKPRGA